MPVVEVSGQDALLNEIADFETRNSSSSNRRRNRSYGGGAYNFSQSGNEYNQGYQEQNQQTRHSYSFPQQSYSTNTSPNDSPPSQNPQRANRNQSASSTSSTSTDIPGYDAVERRRSYVSNIARLTSNVAPSKPKRRNRNQSSNSNHMIPSIPESNSPTPRENESMDQQNKRDEIDDNDTRNPSHLPQHEKTSSSQESDSSNNVKKSQRGANRLRLINRNSNEKDSQLVQELRAQISSLENQLQTFNDLQESSQELQRQFLSLKMEVAEQKSKNDVYELQVADLKCEIASYRSNEATFKQKIQELKQEKREFYIRLKKIDDWKEERFRQMKTEMDYLMNIGSTINGGSVCGSEVGSVLSGMSKEYASESTSSPHRIRSRDDSEKKPAKKMEYNEQYESDNYDDQDVGVVRNTKSRHRRAKSIIQDSIIEEGSQEDSDNSSDDERHVNSLAASMARHSIATELIQPYESNASYLKEEARARSFMVEQQKVEEQSSHQPDKYKKNNINTREKRNSEKMEKCKSSGKKTASMTQKILSDQLRRETAKISNASSAKNHKKPPGDEEYGMVEESSEIQDSGHRLKSYSYGDEEVESEHQYFSDIGLNIVKDDVTSNVTLDLNGNQKFSEETREIEDPSNASKKPWGRLFRGNRNASQADHDDSFQEIGRNKYESEHDDNTGFQTDDRYMDEDSEEYDSNDDISVGWGEMQLQRRQSQRFQQEKDRNTVYNQQSREGDRRTRPRSFNIVGNVVSGARERLSLNLGSFGQDRDDSYRNLNIALKKSVHSRYDAKIHPPPSKIVKQQKRTSNKSGSSGSDGRRGSRIVETVKHVGRKRRSQERSNSLPGYHESNRVDYGERRSVNMPGSAKPNRMSFGFRKNG